MHVYTPAAVRVRKSTEKAADAAAAAALKDKGAGQDTVETAADKKKRAGDEQLHRAKKPTIGDSGNLIIR